MNRSSLFPFSPSPPTTSFFSSFSPHPPPPPSTLFSKQSMDEGRISLPPSPPLFPFPPFLLPPICSLPVWPMARTYKKRKAAVMRCLSLFPSPPPFPPCLPYSLWTHLFLFSLPIRVVKLMRTFSEEISSSFSFLFPPSPLHSLLQTFVLPLQFPPRSSRSKCGTQTEAVNTRSFFFPFFPSPLIPPLLWDPSPPCFLISKRIF